jgi:molybdopterin-guanine dinucleotide biosynthesis protein A
MSSSRPLGVVLAGGAGRRIGGEKTLVELDGRPLLHYPLAVLHATLGDVVVICKESTPLPELAGRAAIWCEPEEPRHPLAGVAWALRQAPGRDVLVCAGDMPLVTAELVRMLLAVRAGEAAAVVPVAGGRLEPLLAVYRPAALPGLQAMDPGESATAVVERLGPLTVAVADEDAFFSVNAPEDVLRASALLAARAQPATSRT